MNDVQCLFQSFHASISAGCWEWDDWPPHPLQESWMMCRLAETSKSSQRLHMLHLLLEEFCRAGPSSLLNMPRTIQEMAAHQSRAPESRAWPRDRGPSKKTG